MPKTSAKTSPPKRSKRLLLTVGIILLLFAAAVVGFRIYSQHALAADKARFAQAEKDINDLSAAITTAVGQPLKADTQKFCSRPHLKFSEGPLSCNISSNIFFGISDEKEATNLFTIASSTSRKTWSRIDIQSSSNLNDVTGFSAINDDNYRFNSDYEQIFEDYSTSIDKMKCKVTYNFYVASQPPFNG